MNDEQITIFLDWTYAWLPTLDVFRMPYPELVRRVRPALLDIKTNAVKMEREWIEKSQLLRYSQQSGENHFLFFVGRH